MPARFATALLSAIAAVLLGAPFLPGCTLDIGDNFQVAEVVYEEEFFYCQVEPMLFAQGCGSGDSGRGESAQGCHFNRQGLRLTDYEPLISELCEDGRLGIGPPAAAQQNYQSAQLFMELDPERADLLRRPTNAAGHPRVVIEPGSDEAELIRTWATRYSSQ